jgi:hypothetical protein
MTDMKPRRMSDPPSKRVPRAQIASRRMPELARRTLTMLQLGPVVFIGTPRPTWKALERRGLVVEDNGKWSITGAGEIALKARRW